MSRPGRFAPPGFVFSCAQVGVELVPTRSQCVCAWKRSDRAYGARRSNESLEDVRERFCPMIEQDRRLRTTTMASFAGTGNRVDTLFFPLLFSCSAAVIFGRSLDSTGVFADFQICLPLYRDLQAGGVHPKMRHGNKGQFSGRERCPQENDEFSTVSLSFSR